MTDIPIDDATRRYSEQLAALLDGAGFPRMPARVLMALVTSPEGELTAEQISQTLGISPAAVSGAVRYLRSVQVVRVASLPGTRRRIYTLAPKWYTITLSRSTMYGELREIVRLLPPSIGPDTPAGQRVREMADFYAYLSRRFPEILEEWLELKAKEEG
ncbi:MAG: helix-turn-helix domain-containing protein [Tessaracoccus sp.]